MTTTAPIEALNSGSTDPAALLDGNTSGTADTYVEWQPPHLFTYELADVGEIDEFHLWNDRGQQDSGIGHFSLDFRDEFGIRIGSVYFDEAVIPAIQNDPVAEIFSFSPYAGVKSIILRVWTEASGDPVAQFREVEFATSGGTQLTGPAGGIESVTTTAPVMPIAGGGSSDPAATINGIVNGTGGTFVEWVLIESAFTFELSANYDLTDLRLWNDRGQVDAWGVELAVRFLDDGGAPVGTPLALTASMPAATNDPSPEVISFGSTRSGVRTVEITVESGVNSTVQLREIAFAGECSLASSAQITRVGSPPNPLAFLDGVSSGPVIGSVWDPVLDHTSFVPGSIADFLILTGTPINVSLGPQGTLLCNLADPFFFFAGAPAPGMPFALPIPDLCSLVGLELCAQGGSLDGSFASHLANALDLVIGNV